MNTSLTSLFDFILLKLAKLFVKQVYDIDANDINSIIESFNEENNFDKIKLNLYPYLITMGNGHKDELLKIFGSDFFFTSFGLFHKEFFVISNSAETKNLSFVFNSKGIKITLKPNFLQKYNQVIGDDFSKNLIKSLCDDIENQNGLQDVLEYIDQSINSINKKFLKSFVSGTHVDLLNINRTFSSFIKLENAIRNLKDSKEKNKLQETFNSRVKYERSSLEIEQKVEIV